jgi:hypothetical protein
LNEFRVQAWRCGVVEKWGASDDGFGSRRTRNQDWVLVVLGRGLPKRCIFLAFINANESDEVT